MKPVIYIHTSKMQLLAAKVCAHSLRSRSKHSEKFEVRFLMLEENQHLCKRHGQNFYWHEGEPPFVYLLHDLQAFAPLRKLVPQIMGYQGKALLLDPDIFAVGDVYDLLSKDMGDKAILCRTTLTTVDGRLTERRHSAVMLLDCSKLTHWRWNDDIDALFAGELKMAPWLQLQHEPQETIGSIEEEWNHLDTLNEQTKLLHTTEINTQPWKTGLPADYHGYAQRKPFLRRMLKRIKSLVLGTPDTTVYYRPHPDPRQERYFFSLLQECLDERIISKNEIREAIRKKYIRGDAFSVLSNLKKNGHCDTAATERDAVSAREAV